MPGNPIEPSTEMSTVDRVSAHSPDLVALVVRALPVDPIDDAMPVSYHGNGIPIWGKPESVATKILEALKAAGRLLPEPLEPDPDPMPVFEMKGKDALALETVGYYRLLCEQAGLAEQAEQVRKAFVEMSDWRVRNPERVKFPDHAHVPVAGPPAVTA